MINWCEWKREFVPSTGRHSRRKRSKAENGKELEKGNGKENEQRKENVKENGKKKGKDKNNGKKKIVKLDQLVTHWRI